MFRLAYPESAADGQVPPREMHAFTVLPFALSCQLIII